MCEAFLTCSRSAAIAPRPASYSELAHLCAYLIEQARAAAVRLAHKPRSVVVSTRRAVCPGHNLLENRKKPWHSESIVELSKKQMSAMILGSDIDISFSRQPS